MSAKKIMIQSTGLGTSTGKSFIVALLCRLFRKQGIKVAPFKTLNLTAVTLKKEGREFGYSQALQAISAKIEPDWKMNPYTIKPIGRGRFNIFTRGKMEDKEYNPQRDFLDAFIKNILLGKKRIKEAKEKILQTLSELEKEHDLIVIEGTGGTKIWGLASFSSLLDMGNMGIAKAASLPTIFITDNLDSIPQTISYLDEDEKKLLKGAIANKIPIDEFSRAGIEEKWLDLALKSIKNVYGKKINLKIFGVLPYFEELKGLPDLDPISTAEKIPLEIWDEKIEIISQKAQKYLDLEQIYELAK